MGILEFLLANLSPEAKKELAKHAVESVGDAVSEKVEEVRRQLEEAARKERESEEQARARAQRERERVEGEKRIDDELAALKARVEREQKK